MFFHTIITWSFRITSKRVRECMIVKRIAFVNKEPSPAGFPSGAYPDEAEELRGIADDFAAAGHAEISYLYPAGWVWYHELAHSALAEESEAPHRDLHGHPRARSGAWKGDGSECDGSEHGSSEGDGSEGDGSGADASAQCPRRCNAAAAL